MTAGRLFADAESNYQQSRPIEALKGFLCSHDIIQHENTLFNIAQIAKITEFQGTALAILNGYVTHTAGANKTGPNLYGILGRDIGSLTGFGYSPAMKGKEGNWDYEALNAFLAKPKDFVPKTKMAFGGIKKAGRRANMILYLRSLAKAPKPLP